MRNKRAPVFTRKLISLVMPIAFQQFMLALVSASDAWRNFLGFTVSGISGRIGYFYSQPVSRSYDYWSFSYSCPVLGQGRYSGSREDIRLCDESYNCDITNLYLICTAAFGNADENFYK